MSWFSHWRSHAPRGRLPTRPHASRRERLLPSSRAATPPTRLLLHAAFGLHRTHRLTIHCQWGWLSIFFVFWPRWPWPLTLIFELGENFLTMHLTANFHHPMFNRSEVIVRTNKQSDKQKTPRKHPPRFTTLRRWVNRAPTLKNTSRAWTVLYESPPVVVHCPLHPAACRATTAPSQPRLIPTVAPRADHTQPAAVTGRYRK